MTTEAQIAALENAIATGALEVEYRSGETMRKVKYRSLSEMERALNALKQKASASVRVSRTVGIMKVF